MKLRLLAWLLIAAGVVSPALARERNAWPFRVDMVDDATDQVVRRDMLGPLYSWGVDPDGSTFEAWRPLFLKTQNGDERGNFFLYPLFFWRSDAGYSRFSFFDLVNKDRIDPAPGTASDRGFDIWPIYFSRETDNPAANYHALFPIAGTIKQRFGKDRLTWWLFPLYFNTEKSGMQITSAPWPFIRVIKGAGHHGIEFWPVYGSRGREGDYSSQFWLWPLGYRVESNLSAPQPDLQFGLLPFYAMASGPGYRSESYAWPFFGYTHRTEPAKYDERRCFWPFLLQGRGDDHYINRWGPFYTHSIIRGYDKTWLMWPVFRDAKWIEDGVAQEKTQLLYFLYSSLEQHSLANPAAAPAYKRHLWPLFSIWDNVAGQRQLQVLSPFEVFFPHNEPVRQLYTPLFAIYRYDQRAPGDTHGSILWNLISWRNSPRYREFHLGPLGWHRDAGEAHTNFFLFDFHGKKDITAKQPASP